VESHPRWSQITILDLDGKGDGDLDDDTRDSNVIWIDPSIWRDLDPEVFCDDLPCTFQFPPWTSATSTINYPIATISDGDWATKVTRKPITVFQWVFELITVTDPNPSQPSVTTVTTTLPGGVTSTRVVTPTTSSSTSGAHI
jgi:hypothetical protein